MDAHSSPSDDISDVERRLSAWRPSTSGLDADGLLFAAGRASVRPGWGRVAWPIVSGCLALSVATLGVGLSQERAARLELTAQLRHSTPAVMPTPPSPPETNETPFDEPPAPASYLAARRALADNSDSWLATRIEPTKGPAAPNRPIWNVGSHPDMLEP